MFAVLDFLHLGFKDYLGARALLRASLPIQGAILGSTAIEKYLKAFLAHRGNEAHGHLKRAHWNALRSYLPDLWARLNPSFFLFLKRCYDLRYTDHLVPGFNLVAYSREVLAELDHSIALMHDRFNFVRDGQGRLDTAYDRAVSLRDYRLFDDNHVLLGIEKGIFLKQPDKACAIRHRGAEGLLEVEFTVNESPMDGKFEREALIPRTPEELRQHLAATAAS